MTDDDFENTSEDISSELLDRRDHKLEQRFISLLEKHSKTEETVINELKHQLTKLQESNDTLVANTREIIDAYDTTQKAIKVSVGFGKFIKFVAGIIAAYYAIDNYIHPTK